MFAQEFVNGLATGSIYALVALGFVLVFKATGVINFAAGEIMMFCTYMAFTFIVIFKLNYIVAFILTLLASAIFGAIIDRVLIRPIMNAPVFNIVIATIALSTVLRSIAGMVWGWQPLAIPTPLSTNPVHIGGLILNNLSIWTIIIAVILMVVLLLFFKLTNAGTAMRATSENKNAALLMGINIKSVYSSIWAISSVIGAIAGLLLTPIVFLKPILGFVAIKSFAAAIVGGFGSVPGAIVGGMFLGVTENIAGLYLPSAIKHIFAFIILVAILIIKPTGFFGITERKNV